MSQKAMNKIMNDTIGENYIAAKGRDTLRKIVCVSPRVVLTECEYKEVGWRYELWPTEPSESWLTFKTEEEQMNDPEDTLNRLSLILRSQLETEKKENEMRLKQINKNLDLIGA